MVYQIVYVIVKNKNKSPGGRNENHDELWEFSWIQLSMPDWRKILHSFNLDPWYVISPSFEIPFTCILDTFPANVS